MLRVWMVATLVGAVGISYLIQSGISKMRAPNAERIVRKQEEFKTQEEWLLSKKQLNKCNFKLNDFLVETESAAREQVWDVRKPPKLVNTGASHFYGIFGSWTDVLLPDIVIEPEAVEIDATPDQVWEVLMDFDTYRQWNPFHREVEIVEREDRTVRISMQVEMGGLIGNLQSDEVIFYVDSKRKIMMYGIDYDVPSSLRVLWLVYANGKTIFNSYDVIGGYPALFCRGYIRHLTLVGFTKSHLALKDEVENRLKK